MNKRHFLGAAALAGALPAALSIAAAPSSARNGRGPALLTITGAIARPNRPALDPLLDQMMFKQKLAFDKAFAMDWAALTSLPALDIRPTLEYDAKVHLLRGTKLADVLTAAGARLNETSKIVLRAVDGYAATMTLAEVRAQGMIVATHLDGQPMALGGLGPLWAVYDADRHAPAAARPLAERFSNCPWALYHIDVGAA